MQQKNGSALGRTVCIDASPPGLLSGADTDSALRRYEIVCGEANANGNNKQYKYNNAANNDNQAGNHANKGTKMDTARMAVSMFRIIAEAAWQADGAAAQAEASVEAQVFI